MNAETILESRRQEISHISHQKRADFAGLIDQSTAIQHLLDELSLRVSRSLETGYPWLTLRLKQERLAQQRKQSELRFQALRNFIEVLHMSGKLSAQPLKNWLSINQPLLPVN